MPTGWAGVAEVEVTWTVSGGTAPYSLEIDGERRDAFGPYEGARGTAAVSCALAFADSFIHESGRGRLSRRFTEEPTVDSGWKTIEVTAQDADGNTGVGAVDIYVILTNADYSHRLLAGETYRVHGWYLTIPAGRDMWLDSYEESDCKVSQEQLEKDPHFCENAFAIGTFEGSQFSYIQLGVASGRERSRSMPKPSSQTREARQAHAELHADFDSLAKSVRDTPLRKGD